MKWAWNVIGVVSILAGGVFALQGLSVLPGTYMRGRPEWVIIGAIMVVIGLALLTVDNLPKGGKRT